MNSLINNPYNFLDLQYLNIKDGMFFLEFKDRPDFKNFS